MSLAFIYISFSVVFAGEQEKDMLKVLQKLSTFSDNPRAPEFLQALSDCQTEIKITKAIGADYPAFMKVAEETFLLFKAETELMDEMNDSVWDIKHRLTQAKINNAPKIDILRIEEERLRLEMDYLDQIKAKQEAGRKKLDDLYLIYKKEVLKK